ncbi:MAG TPA: DUF4349 domain-containing protein [Solirubrobacteraceae bacterium]|nr:DUF4349 domain-containing protein [Solirubrobacteraceae bacterium]
MRVIPFRPPRMSPEDGRALARIEAALDGDGTGPEAEYWRELRADIRSLPEPADPAFVEGLKQRVRAPEQPSRPRRRLAAAITRRRGVAVAIGASLAALLVAVFAVGVPSSRRAPESVPNTAIMGPREKGPPVFAVPAEHASNPGRAEARSRADQMGPAEPSSSAAGATGEAPGEAGGRLQQLGASLTLSAGGEGVQQVADRVGRTTVSAGGFVQSARVQTQHGSGGEALLTLVLPSAKLQRTLAQLERIAPVRAETQSLQDITSEYHAAGGRLASARAERAALLRALGRATTQAAIESIHARLAEAARDISSAEHQRAAISRRASRAQVEVTVLGVARNSGGSTLSRGVKDAGRVLAVMLSVILVALAVLLPLSLVLAALLLGGRLWRRQRRERVLRSG